MNDPPGLNFEYFHIASKTANPFKPSNLPKNKHRPNIDGNHLLDEC